MKETISLATTDVLTKGAIRSCMVFSRENLLSFEFRVTKVYERQLQWSLYLRLFAYTNARSDDEPQPLGVVVRVSGAMH